MVEQHNKLLRLLLLTLVFVFSFSTFSFGAEKQETKTQDFLKTSIQITMDNVIQTSQDIVNEQKEQIEKEKERQEALRRGQKIVECAQQYLGNPYVYGGTSLTNGTDCSGFTQQIFKKFGISLPRTSGDQSRGGVSVSENSMKPGDLIFYSNGNRISHVAIYYGGGQIIHASNHRDGIKISKYNYQRPACIKRYW